LLCRLTIIALSAKAIEAAKLRRVRNAKKGEFK
jgi:hypothetical protein